MIIYLISKYPYYPLKGVSFFFLYILYILLTTQIKQYFLFVHKADQRIEVAPFEAERIIREINTRENKSFIFFNCRTWQAIGQ